MSKSRNTNVLTLTRGVEVYAHDGGVAAGQGRLQVHVDALTDLPDLDLSVRSSSREIPADKIGLIILKLKLRIQIQIFLECL